MKTKIPIEQRYGYHIISTDKDKKKFAPKLLTDEYFSSDGTWRNVSCDCGTCQGYWKHGGNHETYRRKIDVGEGFELVGLEEAIKEYDEWSECGIEWSRLSFGVGVTVREYHQNESRITHHIRRKKSARGDATFVIDGINGISFASVQLASKHLTEGGYTGKFRAYEINAEYEIESIPASTKVTKL